MSALWKVLGAIAIVVIVLVAVIAITGQKSKEDVVTNDERIAAIPSTAVKMTSANDSFKPVTLSSHWKQPVPMPGPVNTAGAEDSPFMTANGSWFFFFFTPDMSIPAEKQLLDGVTGIWWMQLVNGSWSSPEKIILNDDVSMDGAEAVVGTTMWFGSVRVGNLGEIDVYSAQYENGKWTDVENLGPQLNSDIDIGEFHLMANMSTMYFHTGNVGLGPDMHLWVTQKTGSTWSTPVPLTELYTGSYEGYPYVTEDGNELWFTSNSQHGYTGPAIFRSVKQLNGTWGTPEEIIGNFAGECTMDPDGNIYFVHHYYQPPNLIEADIYVAYKQ